MEKKNSDKYLELPIESLKYNIPFSMIVAGQSFCGKSYWVFQMIENLDNIFTHKVSKIYYLYSEYQDIFDKYKDRVSFTSDVSILDIEPDENTLLIIDDLMDELSNSNQIRDLFTKKIHHRNISVILILQNIFVQGKVYVTIRNNTCYYIIFDHGANYHSLEIFAQRFQGKHKNKYFEKSYEDCMKTPYSPLLIDNHPKSDIRKPPLNIMFRAKTNFVTDQILYLPK